MDLFQQILELHNQVSQLEKEYFFEDVFLSTRWWILMAITFLPWFFWLKIVDKRNLVKITMFLIFTIIFVIIMDEIGFTLRLWDYNYSIAPFTTISLSADLTYFPLTHAILYQYFPKWKNFIIANIILAPILAFVMEPIAIWADYYVPLRWEHWYGVPIYIGKAILAKWLTEKIVAISKDATL